MTGDSESPVSEAIKIDGEITAPAEAPPNSSGEKVDGQDGVANFKAENFGEQPPPLESTPSPAPTPEAPYGYKADGTPAKKRGRKSPGEVSDRLDSVTPRPPRPQPGATPTPPPTALPIQYEALGAMAANLFFNVGVMAVGEEFVPKAEEANGVHKAFTDYFRVKGIGHLEPGYMLAATLGGYVLSRVTRPTVKQRIGYAYSWLKSKLSRR